MDTDTERRVRDALAGAADGRAVDVPDPVRFRAGVQAPGYRRRYRRPRTVGERRWIAPVVSAALVVGGWLGISLLVTSGSVSHRNGGAGVAPSVRPLGTAPGSAGTETLPTGMTPTDFSFVSDTDGWVIGQGPCASALLCTEIEHTADGGRSWQPMSAPNLRTDCSAASCPTAAIRFADDRNGYAYTDQSFYATTDGGASWQLQPGGAVSVEVRNGVALRVSQDQPCNWPCGRVLSAARVGGSPWTPVVLPGVATTDEWWGSILVRTGHRVALAYLRNEFSGGNGSVQAKLFLSSDDGRDWTTRADPCGPVNGVEADTSALASASDGSISALCMPRTQNGAYIVRSVDGGYHFGASRTSTPTGGQVTALSTPDGHTSLVALIGDHQDLLYRSDSGGSWRKVAATHNSGTVSAGEVLGFEDANTGRWIPQEQSGVYSTADGGKNWTRNG